VSDPSPESTTTAPEPAAPAAASGLDIAAIITAFLLAPVGIILGAVSRSQAKQAGRRANVLATVSIIVGSVVTGLTVLSIATPLILAAAFVGNAASSAERATECAQLTPSLPALDAWYQVEIPSENSDKATWTAFIVATDQAETAVDAVIAAGVDDAAISEAAVGVKDYTQHANREIGNEGGAWAARVLEWAYTDDAGELASAIRSYCQIG